MMASLLWQVSARAAGAAMVLGGIGKALTQKEFRPYFAERFSSWDLRPMESPRIWIHGASVGELVGVQPVAEQLDQRGYSLLMTTTSVAGREKASLFGQKRVLPFDHPMLVRRAIRNAAPDLFLLFETELWPNLLHELHQQKIPVLLVNGRISDRAYPRYLKFRPFFRPLFAAFDQMFVQGERDKDRFLSLGAPRSHIVVNGNTKYDVRKDELAGRAVLRRAFGFEERTRLFVAGSVRPGEDEQVIAAFAAAKEEVPELGLIIAPRHKERFGAVASLLSAHGFRFRRWSEGDTGILSQVLLLDTIGDLQRAYAAGDFAFVGGTLVDIGGHNPMEPAMFGLPVIVGPYQQNIRDAMAALREAGGVFEVTDARELARLVSHFAVEPQKCVLRGEDAKRAWERNLGASDKVVARVQELLRGR